MIVHNVLFKLKDPAEVDEAVKVLRSMEGKIEELQHVEVGVDMLHTERSYHIAFISHFETWDDLKAYRAHPVHKPVIDHMNRVVETAAAVDYEV
ncbi:MAG: Dabb family protein [Myxococcota bacterium]